MISKSYDHDPVEILPLYYRSRGLMLTCDHSQRSCFGKAQNQGSSGPFTHYLYVCVCLITLACFIISKNNQNHLLIHKKLDFSVDLYFAG